MQTAGPVDTDVAMGPVTDHDVRGVDRGWHGRGRPAPRQCRSSEPTSLRLLRRVGHVDPRSIDDYRAHGGYEALRLALEHGPEWTLREVTDAKLMGRGGAAFPTGVKWKAVAEQPVHPHYFVCNADESEPGTFKDRVVMEQDPFAVIEVAHDRGHHDRMRAGLPLHPRRVPARDRAPHSTRSRKRAGTASSATT